MRYEKEETNASTKLTYLLIGGGIGAILALLFAPKSGQELREDIADATRKGLEKSKEVAGQLQERAGEYYEVSRERASEFYTTAKEKGNELVEKAKDTAEELGEKARGAAARTTNPISAALEAGKEAYLEEKRRTESSVIAERPTYPKDGVLELPEEKKK